MAFSAQNRSNTLNSILFIALFPITAMHIIGFTFFKNMTIFSLLVRIKPSVSSSGEKPFYLALILLAWLLVGSMLSPSLQ